MLYNMSWLQEGNAFPPTSEVPRLERYAQNAMLFDSEHFSDPKFRHRDIPTMTFAMYDACAKRISQVIGNFDDIISFPVLLNYQRFISIKMADLVAGEHPLITGKNAEENAKIKWITDNTNFYEKLYSIVIDLSRFGDCPIRVYKDEYTGYYDFTIWDAGQWFPIVTQDGTYRISKHCLAWMENRSPYDNKKDYYLHVQVFDVHEPSKIEYYVFHNGSEGSRIGRLEQGYPQTINTGFDKCPVFNLRPYAVSGTVFGYDDYVPIDAVMAEIITRVSQISVILDKHADPAMTGPVSMLKKDPKTGEFYLERSKFYGINEDDTPPSYLTWDGQLTASFDQLEFLINQLYTLSEMGAAITGGIDSSGNAVSGTAMRFKMVNPLAKARRVTNSLTDPLRKMLSVLCSNMPDIDEETAEPQQNAEDTALPYGHISIQWKDGLPDDPRESLEMAKLASGEARMIPLEEALMAYLGKSQAEATQLAQKVRELLQQNATPNTSTTQQVTNKPGPQDGTGVNPAKKGSKTGISNFRSENNKTQNEK